MPGDFHTLSSFSKNFTIAKKAFKDDSVLEGGKIDAPLLMVGLMYREVVRAMETEDDDGKSPEHLVNSPFGGDQLRKLETLINSVV